MTTRRCAWRDQPRCKLLQATCKALREKLKLDARTKPAMLAAAVDLARDISLQPAKV